MTVDGPLPLAAEGYAVDTASGVVHRRYAGHAIGLPRTRKMAGVWVMLGYQPEPCRECFPAHPGEPAPVIPITADDLEAIAVQPRTRRRRWTVPPVEDRGS